MKKFDLNEKIALKLIALILAVTIWIYVNGELHKSFGPKKNDTSSVQKKANNQ